MGDLGEGPGNVVIAKMPNPRSRRHQTIALGEDDWKKLGLSLAAPMGGTKKGEALYAEMFDRGRIVGRALDKSEKEELKRKSLTEPIMGSKGK